MPLRGPMCDCCGARVPQFLNLNEELRFRILRLILEGRTTLATSELRSATRCGPRWAKIWILHRGVPQARFPGPPCAFCNAPLPNSRSRQCLHCKASWHDRQVPSTLVVSPPRRGDLLWTGSIAGTTWDVVFDRLGESEVAERSVWLLAIRSDSGYLEHHWWSPESKTVGGVLPNWQSSDVKSLKAVLIKAGRSS